MKTLAYLLIIAAACIHVGFFALETLLWDSPMVQSVVQDFTPEALSSILARNQGLYNGFLAAGLFWGLITKQKPSWFYFLLVCIAIAGVYGSMTLGRPTAAIVQTVPALLALILLFFSTRNLQMD